MAGGLLAGLLVAARPAGAQPAADGASEASEDPHRDRTGSNAVDRAENANSPVEQPGETYYFVGGRFRTLIVPAFMINLFGDGGHTVVVPAGGPEFGIRKDGFETNLSMWLASYHMKDTPFKAKDDPAEAYEIVQSQIKVFYLTSDFLWSSEISPEFAINYGLGAGFGFVFGKLFRTQAWAPQGENADPDTFEKCSGPFDARDPYGWCQDDNEHYSGYTEPSWANGGSKPVIFPWLALQTGFRVKPHRNLAMRLDMGFGTSGFFLGLGGDYGI